MNKWTCYICKYECVPIYANPCRNCLDGDLFEPAEAMFRENVRRNQRKDGENHDD